MNEMTRRAALAGMVGGVAGCGDSFGLGGPAFGSFLGRTPPSLEAGGTWLNTEAPLTIAGLAGSVVWLEFSFLR